MSKGGSASSGGGRREGFGLGRAGQGWAGQKKAKSQGKGVNNTVTMDRNN